MVFNGDGNLTRAMKAVSEFCPTDLRSFQCSLECLLSARRRSWQSAVIS